MEVGAFHLSARADETDTRPGREALAQPHDDTGQVRVPRADAVPVSDDDHRAPAATARAGEHDAPRPAAATGVPNAAGKSTPAWNRAPRGPKRSPVGPGRGRPKVIGERGGGSRRAATVRGPAVPSGVIPAHA